MSSSSSSHMANGSKRPEPIENQGRLYSMKYCPFAHRVRLILTLKQIPHDIVNINLQDKPDWYFQIHPEGKVPAYVDTDDAIITDSVTIANYLDQKYPAPPLYNDKTKSRDLELLDHFSKIINTFSNCIHDKDKRQFEEIVVETKDNLQEFEEELGIRKTPFFGGNNPGMLDILMWPWFERAKALTILYKRRASLDNERFPNLMDWLDEMKGKKYHKIITNVFRIISVLSLYMCDTLKRVQLNPFSYIQNRYSRTLHALCLPNSSAKKRQLSRNHC